MELAINGDRIVKVYSSGVVRDEVPAIEFKLTPTQSSGTALSWRIVDRAYTNKAWRQHPNMWGAEWSPAEVRREAAKIVMSHAQKLYAHILEG